MLNVSMYHANVKCMYLTTLIIKQENYLYLCACENYNNSVARFNILSLKRSKNLSCTAVFIFFFFFLLQYFLCISNIREDVNFILS